MRDRSYRSLFYFRVGNISCLLSLYMPGENNLMFFRTCIIEGGVYPAHAFSSVVKAKRIGKNFSFRHLTTIGNKQDGRNDLVPTIGDNVFLGANVTILGDIYIGDNVVIGAGSVVVNDIPSNSIAVGNPAKVIKQLHG